jgi:glycogen debranching enzyme
MTMFGRDSIIASLQALPFTPDLAATTLRELGLRQGTRIDDFRDEDPGDPARALRRVDRARRAPASPTSVR